VVGARWDLARIAGPSKTTVASAVGAVPIAVAAVGALGQRAIEPSESNIALARPIHANSAEGAVIWASSERAILANKSWLAEAGGVVAVTIATAVVGARPH